MKNYELVLLLNASLQEKDRQDFVAEFEKEIKGAVVQKDEIGLFTTAHDFGEKTGNNRFYFVSYYIKADSETIELINKFFLYNKAVYRYFLYSMNKSNEMFSFEQINQQMNKVIENWVEKKIINKVTFFSNPENKKYITWKAVPMLKKYMTRFGNIKPRKYTGNTVSVQKLLRNTIIRAREMGFLEFIK